MKAKCYKCEHMLKIERGELIEYITCTKNILCNDGSYRTERKPARCSYFKKCNKRRIL